MWEGVWARATHQGPPLSQGSWSACSCPSHRRLRLGTDGGEKEEGSPGLWGCEEPGPTLEWVGDTDRNGREEVRGWEREKKRHRDSEKETETQPERETCRETDETHEDPEGNTQKGRGSSQFLLRWWAPRNPGPSRGMQPPCHKNSPSLACPGGGG